MGRITSAAHIPSGTSVFIDANIFIYHFIYETPESQLCTSLLKRVENGEITGVTSTIVLAEISHRLMVFEAIEKYDLNSKNGYRKINSVNSKKGIILKGLQEPKNNASSAESVGKV